ncbi:MAG: hypothetical protein CVV61_00265 [Tenericutes bacterium HGW-Tenericutes-6]|nr:MAG: hypothetical protein CVV61_00265 [Tenericutes bacterium HGW-Tenericutes-6]
MKAYIYYLIKTKWLQTTVLAAIPTILSMTIIGLSTSYSNVNPHTYLPYPNILYTPVILMIIMVILLPIIRLSALKSAKDVDLYYALPMTQTKLYLSHLIFGLIQLIIVWTVMFFISLLVFIGIYPRVYINLWFLPLYLIGMIYISIVYTLNSFLFMRAHSIIDGIAFILLFHVALVVVPGASVIINYQLFGENIPFIINPFSGLITWANTFIILSNPAPYNYQIQIIFYDDQVRLISLILHTVIYISLTISSMIYTLKKMDTYKIENIGTLSHSLFGYRVMIPVILTFSIATLTDIGRGQSIGVIFMVIFTSFAMIGFFIYRRSVKLTKTDILSIIIPVILGIIISGL